MQQNDSLADGGCRRLVRAQQQREQFERLRVPESSRDAAVSAGPCTEQSRVTSSAGTNVELNGVRFEQRIR